MRKPATKPKIEPTGNVYDAAVALSDMVRVVIAGHPPPIQVSALAMLVAEWLSTMPSDVETRTKASKLFFRIVITAMVDHVRQEEAGHDSPSPSR